MSGYQVVMVLKFNHQNIANFEAHESCHIAQTDTVAYVSLQTNKRV